MKKLTNINNNNNKVLILAPCVLILFLLTFCQLSFISSTPNSELRTLNYIDSLYLKKIDSVANDGINKKAYPGCQVIILLKGKVAYQKSYGYQTYDNKTKINDSDIYDLASVTKVAATTLCLMKLVDEGKINIDDKLSKYLPYLINTNKEALIIRDILTHQAGLKDWVPFYKLTLLKSNKYKPGIYNNTQAVGFSVRVAENLYLRDDYKDSIMKQIIKSQLLPTRKYHYSDLGFYLLGDLIKQISGKEVDIYAAENFYNPMGLDRISYLPRHKFDLSEIIPTENDTIFRKQLVHGDVHDPGAAMLGGISGHAGLFSDAKDLALVFQMLLQDGKYKGKTYLKASTIKEFTKCQFPQNSNRRGLGFDKPLLTVGTVHGLSVGLDLSEFPCAPSASKNSFGHSGFTGTFVWADPDYQLVYVFLSNRICPDANNHKITQLNIRTKIQQIIYDSLLKKKN